MLHDTHSTTVIKQFLAKKRFTVLYHPPYLPDFVPADYFLFCKVKSNLKGQSHCFNTISDIQNNVTSKLKSILAAEFCGGIQKLYDRASRFIELGVMFVEG